MSAVEDFDGPEPDLDPGVPADELVLEEGRVVPFRVKDRTSAAWAMRLLRRHQGRFAEEVETAEELLAENAAERARRCADIDEEDARTRAYLEGQRSELQRVEDHFGGLLVTWHRQLLAEDERPWEKKRDRTVKLPDGQLRAKRPADQWIYDDEEAFVAWARETAPDLVRTTFAPAKAEVKKVLAFDPDTGAVVAGGGEIVPGVSVQGAEIEFKVETS